MNLVFFQSSRVAVYSLCALVIVLFLTSTFFYYQKARTQTYNRALILQNDSLLSEQIRLKNLVLQSNPGTGRETSLLPKPQRSRKQP